jgi:mono/diheme cytochrome c family protein
LFPLRLQLRVGVFLPMIVVLTGVGVGCALGASAAQKTAGTGTASRLAVGKALYRTYCGQCHALTAADTAGFGSDNGLGQNGGPSFNNLEVPYTLAIVALTEQFSPRGHEIAIEHMTWQQLSDTANFLATATATNPHSARVSNATTRSPFSGVARGPITSLTPSEITVQATGQVPTSCTRTSSSPAFTGFKVGDLVTVDCKFGPITWQPGVLVSITAGLGRPPSLLTPIPGLKESWSDGPAPVGGPRPTNAQCVAAWNTNAPLAARQALGALTPLAAQVSTNPPYITLMEPSPQAVATVPACSISFVLPDGRKAHVGGPWEDGTAQVWIGSIEHGRSSSTSDASVKKAAETSQGWFWVSQNGTLTSAD